MTEALQIPKTMPCKNCGKKPKREIVAWGYSDKDDEFFLVHWCKGVHVRFPEKSTFTAYYVNGQEPRVVQAWNKLQETNHDTVARNDGLQTASGPQDLA